MDFCLIASGWLSLDLWIAVLKVAIGLGMVIFVHELGHFTVAKMCGVKCEKFYLGFDIGGWKLGKFRWGETEYGIGILPLGGYVKMLGQEDNPARLKEEIERAKQNSATDDAADSAEADQPGTEPEMTDRADSGPAKEETPQTPGGEAEIDVAAAEAALYDPRSYLAQSVPKRMAIISAGVIMNLIFAFLMAVIAYKMGVRQLACGVGQVIPGEAAWQVNLKVGDEITEIAGKKMNRFRDLREAISLGEIEQGIPITVRRPGVQEPLEFTVTPDSSGLLPMIGIINPQTNTLLREDLAVRPGSSAAEAQPPLQLGDTIIKINDEPIENYTQLHGYLALHPDKPLAITVRRNVGRESDKGTPAPRTEEVTVHVPANPMRRLGLVMGMGEITEIQAVSPAAAVGIRPGDKIVKIDGELPGDPMTLPDRLRALAGKTVTLTLERESEDKTAIEVPVTLRSADWYESPMAEGNPMTIPALGVAYRVLGRVHSTIEGSPADKAGIVAGDRIVRATIIPPPKDTWPKDLPYAQKELTVDFDEEQRNWPFLIFLLQKSLPGTQVKLVWLRQEGEHQATLEPVADRQWFNPDRGFIFEPVYFYQTADSWGQAVRWGADETLNSTLLVYRFLQKLGGQVSFKALGGPIAIFTVAKRAADEGTAKLLIFLTLLSANLAVINFLPIPLLDGGHMVLLIWEGIRGKPADERVQIALTYIGLVFILGLMIWVIGLDFHRMLSGF